MEFKVQIGEKTKKLPKQNYDFDSLVQKIKATFSLTNEIFSITYQDEDGDKLAIQNDEEFKEINQQVKKFVVKILDSNKTQEKPQISKEAKQPEHIPTKKIEEPKKQPYFLCKICQSKYTEGQRYRCLSCFDYDVCKPCYNDKKHQQKDHYQLKHQFTQIQSKQKWDKINFRPIIRALLGNEDSEEQENEELTPITHNDIVLQNQNFKKEMNLWGEYYQRLLDQNLDQWINQFQLQQKQIK